MAEYQHFTSKRTILSQHEIFTTSGFCRSGSEVVGDVIVHAAQIREQQGLTPDSPWRINHVGCSRGQETWSIAAGLAQQDIPFHIQAYDINPVVLRAAAQRYEHSKAYLVKAFTFWGLPDTCADFFEEYEGRQIKPKPLLRGHVTFNKPTDIRSDQLAPADLVVASNVLQYYHEAPELEQIATNLGSCLANGGLLVANDAEYETRLAFENNSLYAHQPRMFSRWSGIFEYRE